MSEKTAWTWMREKVFKAQDRADRLENIVLDGMPDANCCVCGTESWIEIKAPTEPVRERTPLFGSNHKISQSQANWMLRQISAGGNAYFFIDTDKRRMLVEGKYADQLNTMTVTEIMLISKWVCAKPLHKQSQAAFHLRNCLIAPF